MTEDDALAAFAALSNQSRLSVIRALVKAGPSGLPAGDIAECIGASPSQTSFHLSSLSACGLITAERRARQMIYRIDFQRVGELVGFLLDDCCAANPEVRECCGLRR
ncbi:MAG: metalloregulator ArsR/SmtB family transcription factor [Rhodospirillales bacterium]